jgi:hypothetical protein
MTRKRTVGKIDTQTMLIVGAAAVGFYLLTRPKTVPPPVYPAGYSPYITTGFPGSSVNPTAGIITASGSALSSILKALDFTI